jgi:hypothetical protein
VEWDYPFIKDMQNGVLYRTFAYSCVVRSSM